MPVGVIRDKVGALAVERDEAAIGADGRVARVPVRLDGARGDRDALGLPGAPVTDEEVAPVVGVPRHQVGGVALKTAKRLSTLNSGCVDRPFPWVPSKANEMRSVFPVCRSWTNMSVCSLVSPGTRLVASL